MDPDERTIDPAFYEGYFQPRQQRPYERCQESVPSYPGVPLHSRLTVALRRWRLTNSVEAPMIPGRRRDPCYHPPVTVVRSRWT